MIRSQSKPLFKAAAVLIFLGIAALSFHLVAHLHESEHHSEEHGKSAPVCLVCFLASILIFVGATLFAQKGVLQYFLLNEQKRFLPSFVSEGFLGRAPPVI